MHFVASAFVCEWKQFGGDFHNMSFNKSERNPVQTFLKITSGAESQKLVDMY